MSEWADANRQAHDRCHDCWNLDPYCTCPIEGEWWVKTETLSIEQIKARFPSPPAQVAWSSEVQPPSDRPLREQLVDLFNRMAALDPLTGTIFWQGDLVASPHPRHAVLSNIDDRADMSTLTEDELEAMAYRAIYLDD